MDCVRVGELIPDYSAEALGARERAAVEAHLATCVACRRELERLTRVMALVEQHAALEPPADLWRGVATAIAAQPAPASWCTWWERWLASRRHLVWMGAAAAAAAAGIWLASLAGPPAPPGPTTVMTPAIAEVVRQHAISSSRGPLADRVAWDTVAELSTPEVPGGSPGIGRR